MARIILANNFILFYFLILANEQEVHKVAQRRLIIKQNIVNKTEYLYILPSFTHFFPSLFQIPLQIPQPNTA